MSRRVLAEEKSLEYLQGLSKPDSYSVGLILGQSVGHRDFVIHLARTPSPASKDVKEEGSDTETSSKEDSEDLVIKTVKDIHDNWVAEHAKHVTRMLPGGMWVLGIFIIGPGDIFADTAAVVKMKSTLVKVTKNLASNSYLHGNGPTSEKLILSGSVNTNNVLKFECRSVDAGGSLSIVDWKFQANPTKWHQLDCHYNFDQVYPIAMKALAQPLRKHLQEILEKVSENVNNAICMIDGEVKSPSETLDVTNKKKKGKSVTKEKDNENKVLPVNLYVPCAMDVPAAKELEIADCGGAMNFQGLLASRVFLHQKATVEEAVQAVKQDIIRSLAARFEMHWDSLIEEENGSPEERSTLHEPPRRVLVSLPHCRVSLSDYLFPGEGPSEALISLQELLDLEVSESEVQKDLEVQADASEFYKEDRQLENDYSEDCLPTQTVIRTRLYTGIMLAILVVIVSFILHHFGFEKSDKHGA